MKVHVVPSVLTAVVAAVSTATAGLQAAAAAQDPLTGPRTIAVARPGVIPECLTSDGGGHVRLASPCFKEGDDHSWRVASAGAGSYLLRRDDRCLTFAPQSEPHLLVLPCRDDRIGQMWQIVPRTAGQYQIGQAWVCIKAGAAGVETDACDRTDDAWGGDSSGQAWKILKDAQSVVPDPTFGNPRGVSHSRSA